MTTVPLHPNQLLARLSTAERKAFIAGCEEVELVLGQVLCEPEQVQRAVYFPLEGFISLLVPVQGHPALEMGLIGSEGMLGATVALGVDNVPLRALVQGGGTALRMDAARFRRQLRKSARLHGTIDRYLYVTMAQLARTAACTRFHTIEARLARWLLMTHDRAHADNFELTHSFLAEMLGVRRSGVTIAAGLLQARKLIRYVRGRITVLDRKGLERTACECYDAVIGDYATVLG